MKVTGVDEIDELAALTGDIYDAALDPARWTEVLEKSARFLDAFAITLGLQADVFVHFGVDPHFRRLYFEKFHKRDPRHALLPFARPGEVYSALDMLPPDDFRDTAFYQEFMQPQGVSENFRCVFEACPTGAHVGIFRQAGSGPGATALRRMQWLMPHIGRALMIGHAVDLGTASAADFADTLDGLGAGVFFLDAGQRVVHANAAGQAMLARGSLLRLLGGRLIANEADGERMLEAGIAAAAKADHAAGGRAIAVPLQTVEGERYVAHLLPLTAGQRREAASSYQAVAALFIRKAALAIASPTAMLAQRYRLTPMELHVLIAIVEMGGISDVADTLGLARSTVKTHLDRIFAKTEVRRQADLVKLIAGMTNPLAR